MGRVYTAGVSFGESPGPATDMARHYGQQAEPSRTVFALLAVTSFDSRMTHLGRAFAFRGAVHEAGNGQ